MKLLHFLDKYSVAQPEGTTDIPQSNSRRAAFRRAGSVARDLAMVGLPLGASLLTPRRAYAQTGTSVADVLNFALTLEYLEAEFYNVGLDSAGLLTGDVRSVVEQIAKHEDQHVEFLQSAISAAGATPVDKPEFDFTAGGTFADVFSNETTFLALAQAFEDTGVRAYKGQAGNLIDSPDVLTAALQIHSVEARHASQIRRIRGSKGWITQDENTTAAAAAAVYTGEGQVTQLGVDVTSISQVDSDGITESFDEPLDRMAVLDIAGLFIV